MRISPWTWSETYATWTYTFGSSRSRTATSVWPSDPPEDCHLTVKKLPKTWHFFKKNATNFHFFKKIATGNFFEKNENFWQFFDSQLAIFRRVSSVPYTFVSWWIFHFILSIISNWWSYTTKSLSRNMFCSRYNGKIETLHLFIALRQHLNLRKKWKYL